MAKRREPMTARSKPTGAAGRRGSKRPDVPVETVDNREHPLPADLAAAFNDLHSRSFQEAQAEQEFRSKMAQAAQEFGREQARLMDALAEQLGISATLQELEALRDRHNRTVIEAFESASSAILTARDEMGRGDENASRPRG